MSYNDFISNQPMPDDHYQSEKLIRKSLLSHKGLIPSINFDEYEYSLYLQYAPAEELEKDIVSTQTYGWITALKRDRL
jgi:hypothetical protein